MAIGSWLRAWRRQYGPGTPIRRPRPFRPVEALEDRTVPAVTIQSDAATGIVTINLGAANDQASITGTNLNGDAVSVTGTGLAAPVPLSGVTAIRVVDTSAGGTAAGQQVTFLDQINGRITLLQTLDPGTGRLDVTGVETVQFLGLRRPLAAQTGVTVAGADAVTVGANASDVALFTDNAPISISAASSIALNAVLLPGSGTVTLTTGGRITDGYVPNPANTSPVRRDAVDTTGTLVIAAAGTGDAVGTAAGPLKISASNLAVDTAANNGNVFIRIDPIDITTTVQTGSIDLGTGTFYLTTVPGSTGTLFMGGANAFNDAMTLDLGANTALDVFKNDVIGGLTGTGTVTNSATAAAGLTVGGNNTTSSFAGLITDGVRGGSVSLTKVGTGTFRLTGTVANPYSGDTLVRDGTLAFTSSGALGSGRVFLGDAGTPAGTGPQLLALPTDGLATLSNAIVVNVPNAVIGTAEEAAGTTASQVNYTGGVTMNLAAGQALILRDGFRVGQIVGPISGTGNLVIDAADGGGETGLIPGSTFTDASGTYADVTIRDGAGLVLFGGTFAQTLPLRPDVHFGGPDAGLLLASGTDFVGAIVSDATGAGEILGVNGVSTLVFGANDADGTYSGTVGEQGGTLSFQKTGRGTQTTSGTISVSGIAGVFGAGRLNVDGPATAAQFVADGVGSTLAGTANLAGPVQVRNGGWFRPGRADPALASSYATLSTGSLTFSPNPAEFGVKLDNPAGGTPRFDRVNSSGLVDVTGPTLLLIPGPGLAANPIPAGTVMPILTSPVPIVGTFAGLPDGSTVTAGPGGQLFLLRYQGTQITLTAVEPPDAQLNAPPVTNASQPNPYTFTVTYTDFLGVDASTFGNDDLVVVGPNNVTLPVTFVSATPAGNGTPRTATYTFVPPGGSWDPADTGTYTVKVGPGPVGNTLGLKLEPGDAVGTIDVNLVPDTAAPTGAATAPNVTNSSAPDSYTFTVTFTDLTAVDATTFGDGNLVVVAPDGSTLTTTFVSATPAGNGTPVAATYTLTPPGGTWDQLDNGTYSIQAGPAGVADTLGNPQPPGTANGTFVVGVGTDFTPPTAALAAPNVTVASTPTSYSFTVTYDDPAGIKAASIGANNVVVVGPTGTPLAATVTNANVTGTTAVVTYRITPPGGSWDPADNGSYAVRVGSSPVADAVNNALPTGTDLGSFAVTVATTMHPPRVAVGGVPGGTAVVLDPNALGAYSLTATISPFAALGANVRTAVADVNGDGFADTVAITGPGAPVRFAVVSGRDNRTFLVGPTAPFAGSENFTGGGFVAAGDLDGDGKAEMVFTPDQGGGPRVTIFSLPANQVFLKKNFFGIDDPNFRGGARAALGDVNRDGVPDLAVAAGFLGGPRVALYNGTSLLGTPTKLVGDFFAFPGSDAVTLRNGVYVAIGDLTGDGYGELIFGGGPGGAPRVFILSGQQVAANNVAGAQADPVANFFVAGNADDRGGVRVATANADGDQKADLVVGSGVGNPAQVTVYLGKTFVGPGEPVGPQVLSVFGAGVLDDGVYVG